MTELSDYKRLVEEPNNRLYEATIKAYAEAASRYSNALIKIRDGTKDTEYPFRAMPREEMQRIAAEALSPKPEVVRET